MLGDWNVVLDSVDFNNGVGTGGTVVGADSRADGRPWMAGGWEGQFYGNNDADADNEANPKGAPSSIAGKFNATFGTPEMATPTTQPPT